MKAVAVTILLAALLAAHGNANLITNGDFETGDITGWTQTGSQEGEVSAQSMGMTPCNGSRMWSQNINGWVSDGFLHQRVYLTPGSYTLSACVQAETRPLNDTSYVPGSFYGNDYVQGHSTGHIRVDLSGGTAPTLYDYDISSIITGQQWKTYRLNFTVKQEGMVTIFLVAAQGDPYAHWTGFDNVTLVQMTPASGPPSQLLVNGSFESGPLGWTLYGTGGLIGEGAFGIVPCDGTQCWRAVSHGVQIAGGAYQQLVLSPGVWTITGCGQGATNRKSFTYYPGYPSTHPYTRVSVRVDLNAGVDENSYTVTTGDFDTGFMWEDANLTFEVPETTLATIFLNGTGPSAEFAGRWMAFDNIKLFAPGAQTVGSVKFGQDGTPADIKGVVVTASSAEAGDNYVESADRSAGIRAAAAFGFPTGQIIDVQGTLGTLPSGERYLSGASFDQSYGSAPLAAPIARISALGTFAPGRGLETVGLLMRAAGRVSSPGAAAFVLADGSGSIKVDMASAGAPPPAGLFVGVTGIVQLEGSSPAAAIPVLRPRSAADIALY